jgi:hypothetical protein
MHLKDYSPNDQSLDASYYFIWELMEPKVLLIALDFLGMMLTLVFLYLSPDSLSFPIPKAANYL